MSNGDSPTNCIARPWHLSVDTGASSTAFAINGDVSASPTPVMPSSVWTRTRNASCVPSATLRSERVERPMPSTRVIFMTLQLYAWLMVRIGSGSLPLEQRRDVFFLHRRRGQAEPYAEDDGHQHPPDKRGHSEQVDRIWAA